MLNLRQIDRNVEDMKETDALDAEGIDLISHLGRLNEVAALLDQLNRKIPRVHLEEWNRLFKRYVLNLFKAKLVESSHPYSEYTSKELAVSIPKAIYLKIEFDPNSSTENECDRFLFNVSLSSPPIFNVVSFLLFVRRFDYLQLSVKHSEKSNVIEPISPKYYGYGTDSSWPKGPIIGTPP